MADFGAGKDAVMMLDVVMVVALMSGIMPRLYLIYFLISNEALGRLSLMSVRMNEATRISGPTYLFGQLITNTMLLLMGNWVVL